ncbi:MAG: hypothetical protein NTX47_05340 [Candidatus Omnitrophica bacterium]|nr:hypothetical protein [Candidatus Omnitrophota bacterium]
MRIILIVVLMVLTQAGPIYGLRLSDTEIDKEKNRIAENIASTREEREKNLHPFVQDAGEGAKDPFDYAAKTNAAAEQETKAPHTRSSASDFKSSAVINFLFISIILLVFLLAHFFIRPKSR